MHRYKDNDRYKDNERQSGFTLIELVITVLVGGILLAIGLPSFGNLIKSNRLTAQTNDVLTAIHVARNEAVNRGHNVRVISINGDTDWAFGWQVRLDVNNNGNIDSPTTIDIVLRNYDAIKKATLVSTDSSIAYESTGFIDQARNPTPIAITLTADECTAEDVRVISVKLSGLVSSERQYCP